METRELSSLSLEDILPHRGSMLLIDAIVEVDSNHALTTSVMKASFPLVVEKGVQPLILVELAAQTAGVCNGLERIKNQGIDSPQMGWLVGVKRARFYVEHVPLGSTVVTRSVNSHKYDTLREVESVMHLDEQCIGEVTLQLFQA